MCQKCEGDCGLWVPNEIILKIYAESLKKIVGAKLGWKWAGLAVLFSRQLQNGSHDFFSNFQDIFLKLFH